MYGKEGTMMKSIIILIILLITNIGCSKKEILDTKTNPDSVSFEAIVVSKNENSLMVVANEGDKVFGRFEPVQVGYVTDDLSVTMGDLIQIEFNGAIRESYPCQIGADQITVVKRAEGKWPASSEIPEVYPLEEAVLDQCFVVALDKTESEDLLLRFLDHSQNGIISYLRKVSYTIEGDPIITDFLFDGKKYYIFEDVSRDKFASGELYKYEYQYINTYETNNRKEMYFANRNDISNTEYENSRNGNNANDFIDSYPLYNKMKLNEP